MPTFRTEIKEIKQEANGVKTFVFAKPDYFDFTPGQYCWISLPDFKAAPMAIASGKLNGKLEFSIRAWGDLTHELFKKEPGDEVTIDGPYGTYFPIDRVDDQTPIYMIAGGTGITPIRSLVKSIKRGRKIVYYGARNPSELLYFNELDNWDADVHLTVDQGDESWIGNVGLVTELLSDLKPYGLFFVCGPNPMEKVVVELLREKGVSDERIYVSLEKFDEQGNVVGPVLPTSDPQVPF